MGWTAGLAAAAYTADAANDEVVSRGIRALGNTARVGYMYKFTTPETVEELSAMHGWAADLMVATILRNEGLFVKFGQGMSTLNHVLPPEYTSRLKVLLDHAPQITMADVRETVERDLGGRIEDVFVSFDATPVASASIAQVHKAQLRRPDGSVADVAVKVLKPKIPRQVWWDLLVHDMLCLGLEKAFDFKLQWTAQTIRDNLMREIDFTNEARYTERARVCFAHRDDVAVPRLFPERCTSRVLVSEWMEATKFLDVETVKRDYDAGAALHTLISSFADGLFRDGFVHADPHPANVLVRRHPVTRKQQVVLLDFGLCIETSDAFRTQYARLWRAMFTRDMDELRAITAGWGIGNAELFASFQLQKPFSTSAPLHTSDVTKEDVQRFQRNVKANINNMLADEQRIPRELIFVGRSSQLLRSLNKSYGAPVNRTNIFAERAAASIGALQTVNVALLKFRMTLFAIAALHWWSTTVNAMLACVFSTVRVKNLEDLSEQAEGAMLAGHHRMDVAARD